MTKPQQMEYVSGAVEQIVGFRPDEFYVDPGLFFEVIGEQARAELLEMNDGSRPAEPRTFSLRHKDGTDAWVEGILIPTFDEAGQLATVDGIARPVTVEHLLAERARSADNLATLRESAGRVAHDLNEALTAILGHATLLSEVEPWGSPERADVEAILRAADRAKATTQQLAAMTARLRRRSDLDGDHPPR